MARSGREASRRCRRGGAIWAFKAYNEAAARRGALRAYEEADRLRKTSDTALGDFLGCVTGVKAVVPHTREELEQILAVGNQGGYGHLSDRIQRGGSNASGWHSRLPGTAGTQA